MTVRSLFFHFIASNVKANCVLTHTQIKFQWLSWKLLFQCSIFLLHWSFFHGLSFFWGIIIGNSCWLFWARLNRDQFVNRLDSNITLSKSRELRADLKNRIIGSNMWGKEPFYSSNRSWDRDGNTNYDLLLRETRSGLSGVKQKVLKKSSLQAIRAAGIQMSPPPRKTLPQTTDWSLLLIIWAQENPAEGKISQWEGGACLKALIFGCLSTPERDLRFLKMERYKKRECKN